MNEILSLHNYNYLLEPVDPYISDEAYKDALYNYANSDRDDKSAQRTKSAFRGNLQPVPKDNAPYSEADQVFYDNIGRSLVQRSKMEPLAYMKQYNIPEPKNWEHKYDLYNTIGRAFVTESRSRYDTLRQQEEALKKRQAELKKKQAAAQAAATKLIEQDLPSHIVSGSPISTQQMQLLTDAQIPESFGHSYVRAQEAFRFVKSLAMADEDSIQKEITRLKGQDSISYRYSGGQGSFHALTQPEPTTTRTDEQYRQQATANLLKGFNLSREQIDSLEAKLTDEKGKFDEAALALLVPALNRLASDSRSVDSAFGRNFVMGVSDFTANSIDFFSEIGSDTTSDPVRRKNKIRSALQAVNDKALSPADEANLISAALTYTGSIAGQEAIPILATAAATAATGGLGGGVALFAGASRAAKIGNFAVNTAGRLGLEAAARTPNIASRNISQLSAEGAANPYLEGTISGSIQAGVASLFGSVTSLGLFRQGMNAIASGAMTVPVLGRTMAAVQSNAALRWLTGASLNTAGELAVEDPLANITAYCVFESVNAFCTNKPFTEQEFAPWKAVIENCSDIRQVTAVAIFCGTLGLFGAGGDIAKARQFATDKSNLKAAGFSEKTANALAQEAAGIEEKIAEIANDNTLSSQDKQSQIESVSSKFDDKLRSKLQSEILNTDHATLKARYEAEGKAFMEEIEAQMAIESGATDAILKKHNILQADPAPDGTRVIRTSKKETDENGVETINEEVLTLSESQFKVWLSMQKDTALHEEIRTYQAALSGNALARSNQSSRDIAQAIENMDDNMRQYFGKAYRLLKNQKYLTYDGIVALADGARAIIEANNYTAEQAATTTISSLDTSLASLASLDSSFNRRVSSQGRVDNTQLDIETMGTAAFNVPSSSVSGTHIALYASGEVSLTEMQEELAEINLRNALYKDQTPEQTKAKVNNLIQAFKELQTHLRKFDPDITFRSVSNKHSSPESLLSDLVEDFSDLQQTDYVYTPERYGFQGNALNLIKHVAAHTASSRALKAFGDAWRSFIKTDEGKAFLESSGKDIYDALQEAGLVQQEYFENLRVKEADRIAVQAANNFDISQDIQEELDTKAEIDDAIASDPDTAAPPPADIPADQSVTGEPISAENNNAIDNDTADGQLAPPENSTPTQHPACAGDAYILSGGSVRGMVAPSRLTPHPALSKRDTATPDAPYNPKAEPIVALHMPDGKLLVISGRTRANIAKADPNVTAVKTDIITYDPAIHTDDWVKSFNLYNHIVNRTATTKDYTEYFALNPMSHAQALENGLVPMDPATGEPTAAYQQARVAYIFKDGKYTRASEQEPDVLSGEVLVENIVHSDEVPQFKTNKAGNKAKQDGVVYALAGEYRLHDPVHLWQRTDGSLVIVSGRHRLAKAKEAGAKYIPAFIFPETGYRDAQWARIHDFEQNVLDNQASVADTAVYVQGVNPKGRKLTEAETAQFTRTGSNSEAGSYIGLHGSNELIRYLSAGIVSAEDSFKIAKSFPDDSDTQNLVIAEMVNLGKGIQESINAGKIYVDSRQARESDFFKELGSTQRQEDFLKFLASYAAAKIREIGAKRRPHKAASNARSIKSYEDAGIKFEDVAKNKEQLTAYNIEQEKWRNPSQYPELMEEVRREFDKTAEGAQDYLDFGANFSVIGPNAKTWGKYTDKAFVGRDDEMLRAEIDSSGAKLKWEDLRGKNVAAYRRIVADWDKLPEEVRKKVEAYADEVYDWQEESDKLDSTPESEFLEQYNKVQKMRDAIKPKREEMRILLNKLFVEHGGSAGAVLNMKSGELDELAMSLWGPYVESKVEDVLDLRPLWHGGMKLADVMDYPELYEAYPELADVVVRYATMDNANGRALYGDGEHEISINRNLEGEWQSIHSILLHEIQHHIQNIEGFAKGGNPSYARRLVNNRAEMGDMEAQALREHSDMELYNRIAGEIEARNVQARYGWSMDRRAAIPFNSTLEYPGEALVAFSVRRKRDLTLEDVHVTQEEAWEHLEGLEGKPLRNARSKFVAVVNKPQRKELTNDNKAKMSAENGFSKGAHYAAVSRIESLFAHAVPCGEYPDLKHGEPTVHIHRFACPMMIDGEKAVAWLTAKQTTNVEGSERLYNLELVGIEKLAVTLEYLASHRLDTALRPASADIVAEVNEAFKTYFENLPDAGSNFSLRRAPEVNKRILLNEGERTLMQVKGFIEHQAKRVKNVLKGKTIDQEAGIHYSQVQAVFNSLDKFIFAKGLINRNSTSYHKLINLRKFTDVLIKTLMRGMTPRAKAGSILTEDNITGFTAKDLNAAVRLLIDGKVEEAVQQFMDNALPPTPNTKANTKKQVKELTKDMTRKVTREQLVRAMGAILDHTAVIIDQHLAKSFVQRLRKDVERLLPKRSKSGKALVNKHDADTQRKVNLVHAVLNMTEEDKALWEADADNAEQTLSDIANLLEATTTTKQDIANVARTNVLVNAAWQYIDSNNSSYDIYDIAAEVNSIAFAFNTFGSLNNANAKDAYNAYLQLNRVIYDARFEWDDKLATRKAARRAFLAEAVSNVPKTQASAATETGKHKGGFRDFSEDITDTLLNPFMSASQTMLAISGAKGFESIGTWTLNRIAEGNKNIGNREWEQTNAMIAAYIQHCGKKTKTLPTNAKQRRKLLDKVREGEFSNFFEEINRIDTSLDIVLVPKLSQKELALGAENVETAEPIHLTQAEMLYLYVMSQQKEYQANLIAAGYTEEVQQTIFNHLGEGKLNFANALRDILQNDGTAEVYRERTGHNLPSNAFYFPARIHDNAGKGPDVGGISNDLKMGSAYSFLKARKKHEREIKPLNIISVFRSALADRNNYICIKEVTDTWRSLLVDPDFTNRLVGAVGKKRADQLKTVLDVLDNAAWGDSVMHDTYHAAFSRWQGTAAVLALGGKLTTLTKQLSAVMHGATQDGTSTVGFIQSAMKHAFSNKAISWSELLESPAFKARWQDNAAYVEMLRAGRNATYSKLGIIARKSMDAIAAMDIYSNLVSAKVYYGYHYDKLKKEHPELPESAIREECMQRVTTMLELIAQPLRQSQKSVLIATANNLVIKALAYMNTENYNKIGYARAMGLKRANQTGSKWRGILAAGAALAPLGIASQVLSMAIDAARDQWPDEDEEAFYFLSQSLIGITGVAYAAQLPIISIPIDALTSTFKAYQDDTFKHLMPNVTQMPDKIENVFKILTHQKQWSNEELVKDIQKVFEQSAKTAGILAAAAPNSKTFTITKEILTALTVGMNVVSTGRSYANLANIPLPDIQGGNEQQETAAKPKPKRRRNLLETGLEASWQALTETEEETAARKEKEKQKRKERAKATRAYNKANKKMQEEYDKNNKKDSQ